MNTTEHQAKAPPELRNVALFLRSTSSGLKSRPGVLGGKRVDYFKGKSAMKALLSPAYAKLKNVPKVASETDAKTVLGSVVPYAFFLRVERNAGGLGSKHLAVNTMQMFAPEEYYVWFFEGAQWMMYAGGIGMVAVVLTGVMFPLWPPVMRQGVGYLSYVVLGLLGLLFAIAIVRLIFYIITVIVVSPGIWIFPNLFADVGFVESFIPLWEWDIPKKKTKKRKGDKGKEKESGVSTPQGATIEEVHDSGISDGSRPTSRGPTIEEAEE
ncbi:translocation protein [Vararia minispora EC-137]|uniref:Translocation protein n=1 Tax=Vararia minispora EC-137 TaxID=1314806 RepID=A0ACB8QBU5_9AGAM|nr:translocation protein [Vararia minispora EC-137]